MGKKTRTSFAKGNRAANGKRNRAGTPSWDRQELAAISIDKSMIKRYLNLNFHLTIAELRAKKRSGRCSALEATIIEILIKACENGDHFKLDFLLDRLVGKVPQKVETETVDPYADKTLEELTAMKNALLASNELTLRNLERENAQLQKAEREVIEIEGRSTSAGESKPDQSTGD